MENASWRGKQIVATEIAKDYYFKKEIRQASGRKELVCIDPECEAPFFTS